MIGEAIRKLLGRTGSAEKSEEKIMKLIVGLGNPTNEYKGTRHNIGYMAADKIAAANGIVVNQHRLKALTGSGFIGSQRVLIMKPLTFMNLSGESVRAAADFYKLDPEDILIIYDDISLEPGKLRIRKKGSAGGHNGIKSIIRHLGGDTFPRIRVGIGGERHPGVDLADYVLSRFRGDELPVIEEALDKAARAAELIVEDEIEKAMNLYNTPKQKKKKKRETPKPDQPEEAENTEKPEEAEKPDEAEKPVETEKPDEVKDAGQEQKSTDGATELI